MILSKSNIIANTLDGIQKSDFVMSKDEIKKGFNLYQQL